MWYTLLLLLLWAHMPEVIATISTKTVDPDPWGSINTLLQGLLIPIPDQFSQNAGKILGSNLLVDITNTACSNIHILDFNVSGNNTSSQNSFLVHFSLLGFTLNCTFDWKYKWSFLSGSGSQSKIYSNDMDNNKVQTTFQVSTSQGSFDLGHPPDQSSITG